VAAKANFGGAAAVTLAAEAQPAKLRKVGGYHLGANDEHAAVLTPPKLRNIERQPGWPRKFGADFGVRPEQIASTYNSVRRRVASQVKSSRHVVKQPVDSNVRGRRDLLVEPARTECCSRVQRPVLQKARQVKSTRSVWS
jgi:hypothetical protein